MARSYPKPDGWVGGPEDAKIIRTLDGHHLETPGQLHDNQDYAANEKTWAEADLGSGE